MLHNGFPKTERNPVAYTLPNNGVILDRMPREIFDGVMQHIEKIERGDVTPTGYQHNLAGHIRGEYDLAEAIPIMNDYIVALAHAHDQFFSHAANNAVVLGMESAGLKLGSLWVNFQRKHEFNPPHQHSGLYSFAAWMRIPYEIEREREMFPEINPANNTVANFNFAYSDIIGHPKVVTVELDKYKEGCICLFPSAMQHFVNPFYLTDDARVSISGNVFIVPNMES